MSHRCFQARLQVATLTGLHCTTLHDQLQGGAGGNKQHANCRESCSQTVVAASLPGSACCMQAVIPSSSFRGGRQLLQDDSQALDRLSKEELIAQLYRLQQQQGAAAFQQGSSGSQQGAMQQAAVAEALGRQQGATAAAAGGTTAVPASSITEPVQEHIIAADTSAGAIPSLGSTAAAQETAAVMNPLGSQQEMSSEQPEQGELQRLLQRRRQQREHVLALIQSQVRLSDFLHVQTQQSFLRCSETRCSIDRSCGHHCRLCCTAMQYDTDLIQKLCLQSTVSPQAAADLDTINAVAAIDPAALQHLLSVCVREASDVSMLPTCRKSMGRHPRTVCRYSQQLSNRHSQQLWTQCSRLQVRPLCSRPAQTAPQRWMLLQQLQLPWQRHSSRLSMGTLSQWAIGSAATPTGGSFSSWGELCGSYLESLPVSKCCKPDCPRRRCIRFELALILQLGLSPAEVPKLASAEPRDGKRQAMHCRDFPERHASPALPIRDAVKTDQLQHQEPPPQASSSHVSVRVKASAKQERSDAKPFYSLVVLTTSGAAAC